MKSGLSRWTALLAINALVLSVLSFYGSSGAAPQSPPLPFDNAVQQRNKMIQELQEIKSLMQDQNSLLRDVLGKTNNNVKSVRPTSPAKS